MNIQTIKTRTSQVLAVVASSLLLGVSTAHAVFSVPTEITDAETNVGLVGAAVFSVMVGIKLWKWLRRAL